MRYAIEFPDYPQADMPAEVAAWDDVSWGNDTCPSFVPGPNMILFVDYAERAKREWPESKRFAILPTDHEGCLLDTGYAIAALVTDDWAEVLAYVSNAINERA